MLNYLQADESGIGKEITLFGTVQNVSTNGLSVIVPYFPLDEQFCEKDSGSKLKVAVYLPTGTVELDVQATRCMPLDKTKPWKGFLIGTRILEIGGRGRDLFNTYVTSLTELAR